MNSITNTFKPLKSHIIDLIRMRGSLSVADYMKIVLTNPNSGFYMNDQVFGVKGHFTTNPEISQIFGEVIGVWILNEWTRFGCKTPFRLVEFGPGRGTLMSDITRTITKISKVDKLQVGLIEVSPKMKEIQAKTLADIKDIIWYNHVGDINHINDGFTAFIAHEYLDALPIYKFIKDLKGVWRELVVDYDEKQELRFCMSQAKSPTLLLVPENMNGNHLEVNPEAALQLQKVSSHLNESKCGCMLICDYGFDTHVSKQDDPIINRDTFRAFKDHAIWPPLMEPGSADLTADVDFGFLKDQLKDQAIVFGSVTQRDFLHQCGLELRLKSLLDSASDEERDHLISGAEMMMKDMGLRYRFMAIYPKTIQSLFEKNPPAGFYSNF